VSATHVYRCHASHKLSCRAIVQLVAELFPESGLLPSDPVERAKARFFIDVVNNQFRLAYVGYLRQGQPGSDVLKSAALLEKMLVGKFALGDRFSVADVAFAPILLTATLAFEVKDPEGVLPQLQGHKRLWQYLQDVKARPSVANLWNDVRS
jgi:glutathione S-transferase